MTLKESFEDEDLGSLGVLVNTSESVTSLPEALALLDKYPWFRLIPFQVHPEFQVAILREVQERATPEEVASWKERLKTFHEVIPRAAPEVTIHGIGLSVSGQSIP